MGCNLPEKYMKSPGYLKKKNIDDRTALGFVLTFMKGVPEHFS
jgi:hypothetical protein